MELCKNNKDEIIRDAEILLYKTNLLIAQCDSWLPEEEGYKNVMMRIRKREKAERKTRFVAAFNVIFKIISLDLRVFRMKSQSKTACDTQVQTNNQKTKSKNNV
jgi:hypothetical protein